MPWPITASRMQAAFRAGSSDPTSLLNRISDEAHRLAALVPGHPAFIAWDLDRARIAASDCSARFDSGEALGPLDGVPVGVKDEVDVQGIPSFAGAPYLSPTPASEDAVCVGKLRRAGALVIGKTHQHELGLGATGVGPQFPVPRNPHDPARAPGGSSSGAAVAVSSGLVPLCIGTDAGGSVRIPASLCGIFGLKPTFGRIPRVGDRVLEGSLGHVGFLSSSVDAIRAALELCCDSDPRDPASLHAPPPRATVPLGSPLSLRIGIDEAMWSDADPDVTGRCTEAVGAMVRAGARKVSIRIDHASISRAVGYAIMGAEAADFHREDRQAHRDRMGLDVRAILALGARIRACDYVRALRLRDILRHDWAEQFAKVDLVASPTTLRTAPLIQPNDERTGALDDAVTRSLTEQTFPANVTGLPAISCPVGVDRFVLPVGLQLVGAVWQEALLLAAAAWLEREQLAQPPRPRVCVDLLD